MNASVQVVSADAFCASSVAQFAFRSIHFLKAKTKISYDQLRWRKFSKACAAQFGATELQRSAVAQ